MENKNDNQVDLGNPWELFILVALGAIFLFVLFVHVGFFVKVSLMKYSLVAFSFVYVVSIFLVIFFSKNLRKNLSLALVSFLILVGLSSLVAGTIMNGTFDTSWDGQGYQFAGVKNLSESWNPVYQKDLVVTPPDGGIFVRGYPKALWVFQSSVYLLSGSVNTAKISNFYIMVVALIAVYFLFRVLRLSLFVSVFLSVAIVLQAPFVMQSLTFMADGFSYQLMLIAFVSLGIFFLNSSPFSFTTTFMVILLLVGTKYSNIPIAFVLSILLVLILVSKKIKEQFNISKLKIATMGFVSIIFLAIPYATNQLHYGYPFFPTNLEAVSATFHDDNTPRNLRNSSNFTLLYFGVFGRAQTQLMGKDSSENIGKLKLPFTFDRHEVMDSAFVFNNRVGSMGPLFSGTIVLSFIIVVLFFVFSKYNNRTLLISIRVVFALAVFLLIAIINPVPNLSRYNSQLVLIPFLVLVVSLVWFKRFNLIRFFSGLLLIVIIANSFIHVYSIASARMKEKNDIERQLRSLESSVIEVQIDSFYSNLMRLDEKGIRYRLVDKLSCNNVEFLSYTSYTTKFCRVSQ